jgi:CubicO group peptidase (beta-lactamase class C family)
VRFAKVDAEIETFLQERNVPSLCVGIVQNGDSAYARAFGMRNRSRGEPATLDTLYNVGSVTKVFTATLAMILVEEGVLGLDDPVMDFLPEGVAPPGDDRITLRHLLQHTSGLPRVSPTRRNLEVAGPFDPGVALPASNADLLEGLRQAELSAEVGEAWSYSNFGYDLLGYVLGRAAEKDYETLLKEKLLDPLSMKDSKVHLTEADRARFAAHYWAADPERKEQPPWVWGEACGAGGLTTTLPDLLAFVRFQLTAEGPLPAAALAAMRVPGPETQIQPGSRQCLGWMQFQRDLGGQSVEAFAHGGEVDGHSCQVLFAPELSFGMVVIANVGGSTAGDACERVLAAWPFERRP